MRGKRNSEHSLANSGVWIPLDLFVYITLSLSVSPPLSPSVSHFHSFVPLWVSNTNTYVLRTLYSLQIYTFT